MNERLKQEYKTFVKDDVVYSKLVNSIVGEAIAQHFYNLALEDLLVKMKREEDTIHNTVCMFGNISYVDAGYAKALADIRQHINELSK